MSSKSRVLMAWLMSLVIGSTGCGLNMGEDAPKQGLPAYEGSGFSCVGQIPEHVEKYVMDELSEVEISEFTRCLQRAFTAFAQLTRGRDKSIYTPGEIRDFLHNYFIRQRRISDGLLRELMVVKQALVGGELESITRAELYQAVEILEDIRLEALRLKPYIKYLNPSLAVRQESEGFSEEMAAAAQALETTIQVFTNRLQKSPRDYPFKNFGQLMTEARAFVGWEEHFQNAIEVSAWVEFFKIFKQLAVSPADPEVIRATNWAPMLKTAAQWYLTYLQYEVGVRGRPILYGVGLQNAVHVGGKVFQLLDQALSVQQGMSIDFRQMDHFVHAIHRMNWIPSQIRPSSLTQAIHAVITKVFGADSFNRAALSRMQSQFWGWAYVQMNLDSRYKSSGGNGREGEIPDLQSTRILPLDIRKKLSGLNSADWNEFLKIKDQKLMEPLFAENTPYIMLVPHSERDSYGTIHGFHNLSVMNIMRNLVMLVFNGYAANGGSRISWKSSITQEEVQQFYMDFRELGVDLGFIDKRTTNAGSRSFIEGNLFTYSADGFSADMVNGSGSQLTMVEAMELFAFLFSGGSMSRQFYTQFSELCAEGPKDINTGLYMLDRACVQGALISRVEANVSNMPGLLNYLKAADRELRAQYAQILMDVSFPIKGADSVKWVEPGQFSWLAVVIHYAEAIMTRYDVDRNGILTNDEIDLAVPVFRGFIQKMAADKMCKNLWDNEARGVLYYIMINKRLPESKWSGVSVWLESFSWLGSTVALDRYELATVFKVILGRITQAGAKAECQKVVSQACSVRGPRTNCP